jgi:hypothetical protein
MSEIQLQRILRGGDDGKRGVIYRNRKVLWVLCSDGAG